MTLTPFLPSLFPSLLLSREGLNARLQFHLSNGVLIYMAFDAASPHTLVGKTSLPPSFPPSFPLSRSSHTHAFPPSLLRTGIYASTAIDHMTIPRLPLGPPSLPPSMTERENEEGEGEEGREGECPFPSVSQTCPRRFLSDVKVGRDGGRKGGRKEMEGKRPGGRRNLRKERFRRKMREGEGEGGGEGKRLNFSPLP